MEGLPSALLAQVLATWACTSLKRLSAGPVYRLPNAQSGWELPPASRALPLPVRDGVFVAAGHRRGSSPACPAGPVSISDHCMAHSVISNMLFRAAHCRRLANSVADEQTRLTLMGMASEIEADAARLELEARSAVPDDDPEVSHD